MYKRLPKFFVTASRLVQMSGECQSSNSLKRALSSQIEKSSFPPSKRNFETSSTQPNKTQLARAEDLDTSKMSQNDADNAYLSVLTEIPDGAEVFENDIKEKRPSTKMAKYAMLVAYQGKNYWGMQVLEYFPEVEGTYFSIIKIQLGKEPCNTRNTIEAELFRAMVKTGLITEEIASKPSEFEFQRAARTDKSVSAVRQICSLKLERNDAMLAEKGAKMLNEHLPADIRVLCFRRATKGFNAWRKCDARTYSYTMPTFAFASSEELTSYDYRISEERVNQVNDLLSAFVGTHNFFNYTSRREHLDESCKRHIKSFKCDETFIFRDELKQRDVEFITIYIKGQSFMMHQIRKMIGMVIAIIRNYMYKSDILRSFQAERMDIPKAPGLGLLLEQLHFDHYDKRFEKTHASLNNWGDEVELEIKKIRRELIVDEILREETAADSMIDWLSTLELHKYFCCPEDETGESASDLFQAKLIATGRVVPPDPDEVDQDDRPDPELLDEDDNNDIGEEEQDDECENSRRSN